MGLIKQCYIFSATNLARSGSNANRNNAVTKNNSSNKTESLMNNNLINNNENKNTSNNIKNTLKTTKSKNMEDISPWLVQDNSVITKKTDKSKIPLLKTVITTEL